MEMAVITCTECGSKISNKAAVCPNCGCPLNEMNPFQIEDDLFLKEQKDSLDEFLGLIEKTVKQYDDIEDGFHRVEFEGARIGEPEFTEAWCVEKKLTYSVPVSVNVRVIHKKTGKIQEQRFKLVNVLAFTPDDKLLVCGEYYRIGKKTDASCSIGLGLHWELVSAAKDASEVVKEHLKKNQGNDSFNPEFFLDPPYARHPFAARIENATYILAKSNTFINETQSNGHTIVYPNGNKYIGHISDGYRDGEGMYYIGLVAIKGTFKQGKITDCYTLYTSSGEERTGKFVDGKLHGPVTFKNMFGTVYHRTYDNGKLLSSIVDDSCIDYLQQVNEGALFAQKGDILSIMIGISSSENIIKWSSGAVYRDKERGSDVDDELNRKYGLEALHNQNIFGPSAESKFTKRFGYIDLGCPVVNVLYYENEDSCLEVLLDMKYDDLCSVIHYQSYIVLNADNCPEYNFKQLLTEEEYKQARALYGDDMEIDEGPAAVRKLLSFIDMKDFSTQRLLAAVFNDSTYESKWPEPQSLLLQHIIRGKASPTWFVQDVLPVLPEYMRPIFKTISGESRYQQIDTLYYRVLDCAERHHRLKKLHAPEIILRNERRMIQERVDDLIKNGSRGEPVHSKDIPKYQSLYDLIVGY